MVYDKLAYETRKKKFGVVEMRRKWREAKKGAMKSPYYREQENKRAKEWRLKQLISNPNFKEQQNKRLKELAQRQRYECIEHYSDGKMNCNCCSENIYMFLEIDHIENNGNKHRKELGNSNLESWLIRNNFPKGFQILCSNCNHGKYLNGGICPHQPGTYA